MNKRLLLLLLSCIGIAIIILVTLLSLTKLPNKEKNGFTRSWISILPEEPIHRRIINPFIIRISGETNHRLFFAGNDPRWTIMTDLSLFPIDTFFYGVEPSVKMRAPYITIDSPHIYMYAREIAYYLSGRVERSQLDTLHLQTDLITRFAQLSPERLVIKGIDSTQSKQVFKLMDCKTGKVLNEINLFKKQQFGGLDTDGFLQYDKSSQRIFYVQMFQNSFFCLDTTLNLLYTAHTIDTTKSNQVATSLVNTGKEIKVMSTKARQSVSDEICTGHGLLFIISGLRGDNETLREFNQYSPVDLYQIKDGTYYGSFKLPKLDGKKAQKIMVVKNLLVVLYPDGLVATYNLAADLISSTNRF